MATGGELRDPCCVLHPPPLCPERSNNPRNPLFPCARADLRNNLARLRQALRLVRYPGVLDEEGCCRGDPAALLPICHHAVLDFSRHVARLIASEVRGSLARLHLSLAGRPTDRPCPPPCGS